TSLHLTGIDYTNAGLYCVVVTGPGGSVTSSIAVVNVFPVLQYQKSTNGLVLTWAGPFILQSSIPVEGPYIDWPNATNPFLVNMTEPQRFFRLRSEPIDLNVVTTGGVSTVVLSGSPGANYIIQASTDLAHWFNLWTNTLPTTFVDPIATQGAPRYYRAILAH